MIGFAIQNDITYYGRLELNSFMEEDNYPIIPHTNNNNSNNTSSGNALHNKIPFHSRERLQKKKNEKRIECINVQC